MNMKSGHLLVTDNVNGHLFKAVKSSTAVFVSLFARFMSVSHIKAYTVPIKNSFKLAHYTVEPQCLLEIVYLGSCRRLLKVFVW